MRAEYLYQIDDQVAVVSVRRDGRYFQVTVGDQTYMLSARPGADGRLDLQLEGRSIRAYVAHDDGCHYVGLDGETWTLRRPERERRRRGNAADAGASGRLLAEMPGLILDVTVQEGDRVARGDTLVLLEAMKMELRVVAPRAGLVSALHCRAGQVVDRGQLLLELSD
jgi:acetyl/propionyl-CoA carboxylase alpha subunit